ncbi:MAG: single-stranded-DNA-specific exonuclease RecJ [Oscillospiraceae bacterium]
MSIKYWKIPQNPLILDEKFNRYSQLCKKIIAARGIEAYDKSDDFEVLTANEPMIGMDLAVKRIRKAISENEKIAIYGDYDCDGITSTALLYSYLESEGADIVYYIPDRDTQGYGLNIDAIKGLNTNGIELIITVDNGISAIEEIDFAQSLGIDVVVTDHHQPREILPNAVAIVDPHRADCPSKLTYLCGVGVVFELITALEDGDYEIILEEFADIIAIGTIADVVPLIGKNKVIVEKGLIKIAQRDRVGVEALLTVSGIAEDAPITSETVAFTLIPRINAAGRLGEVEASLVLMLTEDYEQALHLANEIDTYNKQRKEIETKIILEIAEKIKADELLLNKRIIVLSGENWHHGVIGIVCSRIVEKYGKPCILISQEGEISRGSSRSVEGFSIIEAVNNCKNLLTRYGGHPMAAGMSLKTQNIDAFVNQINDYAKKTSAIMPTVALKIDCEVLPEELTVQNVKSLSELSPYGVGNEYPVFAMKNMELTGITPLSNGKHIKIRLSKAQDSVQVLCFGMTPQKFEYLIGDNVDVAFTTEINSYNGSESVSLKIKDIRLSEVQQDDICRGKMLYDMYNNKEDLKQFNKEIVPTRDDGAIVYKWLRTNGKFERNTEIMYVKTKSNIGFCKFLILLEVMSELKLITMEKSIDISKTNEKKDFNSSKILKRLRGELIDQ